MSPFDVSTEEIVEAYRLTGSVWRAGRHLGMSGQAVHERLSAIGYPLRARHWTPEEVAELAELAEAGLSMGEIARRLGRPFAGVAGQASKLGLRFRGSRERKLPRGQGYDKRSTERHMLALEHSTRTVTQYARSQGLHVDPLVQALERHVPERWRRYVAANAKLPTRECAYCGEEFVPNSGRQRFCCRKHAAHARADRQYFGGKRRTAVGMEAGVCQLCGGAPKAGLSAHHVLGKENDPENDLLVALCRGCHQLVTMLAARSFVDDPQALERLVSLAWMRRNAVRFESFGDDPWELYVEVTVEREPLYEEEGLADVA